VQASPIVSVVRMLLPAIADKKCFPRRPFPEIAGIQPPRTTLRLPRLSGYHQFDKVISHAAILQLPEQRLQRKGGEPSPDELRRPLDSHDVPPHAGHSCYDHVATRSCLTLKRSPADTVLIEWVLLPSSSIESAKAHSLQSLIGPRGSAPRNGGNHLQQLCTGVQSWRGC